MMKHCREVSYRVVKWAALVGVCLVLWRSSDVPGESRGPTKSYTEMITTENGEKISFKMTAIPGGTFTMGSAADEPDRKDDEGPGHEVRLAPFYLCTTETTIELFMAYYQETVQTKKTLDGGEPDEETVKLDAMTGPTPVYGDMTMGYDAKNPAIGMTWHNAATFCEWLSKKTGRKYRLPTEAEWEYACRAGEKGCFGAGKEAKDLKEYAWFEDNGNQETHEVGKKKPNRWGLYDMQGNVREWVHDFYSPTGYAEAAKANPAVNPKGPESGQVHVARGGDYASPAHELRCAARAFEEKWWRMGDPQIPKSKWWLPEMDFIGFRVARAMEASGEKPGK